MHIDSQKITQLLIAGVLIVLVYVAFTNKSIVVDTNSSGHNRSIYVDGEAETFVAPDTASVSFSITQKSSTTAVAMDSVNTRMEDLMAQLSDVGIEEKDVKTTNYDIRPEYSYNDGSQNFEGYRVTQRVQLTIRDLDNVSSVLSLVNTAGVDEVSQLSFFVDDAEEVLNDLRKKAIENAKKNAQELAKDLGVKLGKISGYSSYDDNNDMRPMYRGDMGLGGAMESDVAPAIVPTGENEFKSHVVITYEIE
jgi:uncharacterized protein